MPDWSVDGLELVEMRREHRSQRYEIGAGRLPCLIHEIDKPLRIGTRDMGYSAFAFEQRCLGEDGRVCNGCLDQFLDGERVVAIVEDPAKRNEECSLESISVQGPEMCGALVFVVNLPVCDG
jgi:hypothetical protein